MEAWYILVVSNTIKAFLLSLGSIGLVLSTNPKNLLGTGNGILSGLPGLPYLSTRQLLPADVEEYDP